LATVLASVTDRAAEIGRGLAIAPAEAIVPVSEIDRELVIDLVAEIDRVAKTDRASATDPALVIDPAVETVRASAIDQVAETGLVETDLVAGIDLAAPVEEIDQTLAIDRALADRFGRQTTGLGRTVRIGRQTTGIGQTGPIDRLMVTGATVVGMAGTTPGTAAGTAAAGT
jgi:hypothetical protein